jgi:hypothetical protein
LDELVALVSVDVAITRFGPLEHWATGSESL